MGALDNRLSIISGPLEPALVKWTFNDLIAKQAKNRPTSVAVISQHQNRKMSYQELRQRSEQLATGLIALGLRKGDRLAVMLGNRIEYVEIFLACSRVGAYVTLMNYAYSEHELIAALSSTRSKVLLTTVRTSRYDYMSALQAVEKKVPSLERIIILDDISRQDRDVVLPGSWLTYQALLDTATAINIDWASRESVECDEILNLQFTSGSTGAPKAAALTHFGMMNSARYLSIQMKVGEQDIIAIPVPLFHAFGLIMGLCASMVAGATAVFPSEYFEVDSTLRSVEKYKCTGIYGVTTMFLDELTHPNFKKTNRSTLRFGIMAGSAMPEGLLNRVINEFPVRELFTNWGMTELSSVATMTTSQDPIAKKMKTAGRLLPHLIAKIIDVETGMPVPWGERGEVVVSGFGAMHSYYGDESRTNQAIRIHEEDLLPGHAGRDGNGNLRRWMHTGDEAYLDEDGYFVITGRIKDLIIRGGENISPLEIEARLFEHASIQQAAVFGVPSDRYGEEVAAILELKDDEKRRPSDSEIKDWMRQTLARYKVPVHLWWLGDTSKGIPAIWPKTANGKLKKAEIRIIGESIVKAQTAAAAPLIRSNL